MSKITVLHSAEEIEERVDALAKEIAASLPREFVILGLLKGAFVFVSDLARALHEVGCNPEVEFMRLSSYGLGKVSSGEVHLLGDIPTDLSGKTILLVDDHAEYRVEQISLRLTIRKRYRRTVDKLQELIALRSRLRVHSEKYSSAGTDGDIPDRFWIGKNFL